MIDYDVLITSPRFCYTRLFIRALFRELGHLNLLSVVYSSHILVSTGGARIWRS